VANGRGRSIDLAPGHRHAQCGERKRGWRAAEQPIGSCAAIRTPCACRR